MPHEFFLPSSESKLQTKNLARTTRVLERNILNQLRQSGKHPYNEAILMRMRQLESAKAEARASCGILDSICIRGVHPDKTQFFKIVLSNAGDIQETLVISASPRNMKLEYTKKQLFENGSEVLTARYSNSHEAYREASRILRLPVIYLVE